MAKKDKQKLRPQICGKPGCQNRRSMYVDFCKMHGSQIQENPRPVHYTVVSSGFESNRRKH